MRNAPEYHCPISIIVKTCTLARYIAIAALNQLEWVPTSSSVRLSLSLPMALM